MCGIAGVLNLGDLNPKYPVGASLMTLAACLQHRGADSAGIAVFGAYESSRPRMEVIIPEHLPEPRYIYELGAGMLSDLDEIPGGFTASVIITEGDAASSVTALVKRIEEGIPGSVVTSYGESISIRKVVGQAAGLIDTVGGWSGTHGIAHLRLATESKIDPAHAQPFWGRPYPDIAVTHNGHITNYYKMRKKYEGQGFTLASHNDSEIIGLYLGEKLSQGYTLKESLEAAKTDLDGSFSFIVATAKGLGVTRDPIATKPLLYCEHDGMVVLASEQQGLRHLLGESVKVREIKPLEVRVWERE
jgi:glutamine phosphoribosylpyrophosphate amidotransferase